MAPEVSIKAIFFILVILAIIFEVAGDILLKKWAIDGKNIIFIMGFFVYFLAILFWAYSLKYELLSKAISVVTIINLIAVVLIGVLYFKEDLSLINKIGIALGAVSIALIEF